MSNPRDKASPIRILLLEDSPIDAELLQRQLARGEIAAVTRHVDNEQDFRNGLLSTNPDIILADYNLPGFDGSEALVIARELVPDIPFIFVSGSIGEERAIQALRDGATDYVLKDRPSRLPAAIERALEERDARVARRRMQEALQQSEQRFQLAVLATRDVIWDCDVEKNQVWVNDAARTEWGYELTSPIERDWWLERIHPDDLGRVKQIIRRTIDTGGDRWAMEYRFRRPDGTYGDVYDRGVLVRDADGNATRAIGAMQEFTQRKQAERRAADAERLAQLGYWSEDSATHVGQWSPELYRICGVSPEEPASLATFVALVHPDDQNRVRAALQYGDRPFDCRIVRAGGETRMLHVRIERPESGSTRLFGTMQDVTDRAASEQLIRQLSRQNEIVLEHVADGIVGTDLHGNVTFVNPAVGRIIGFSADVMADGRIGHRALHAGAECPPDCAVRLTLSDGQRREGERAMLRTDGHQISIEYSCTPVKESGQLTGCVLTFRDTTERNRLRQLLEQEQRVSSLGRIAATIAHEFNNVLMGMQPFAELIKRRTDDAQINVAATQIASLVGRGRKITEEILSTTQSREPSPRTIDVRKWLFDLESEIRGVAGPRVDVRMDVSDQPLFVHCDPEQMEQVVLNLAVNARDAMGGAGTLSIEAGTVPGCGEEPPVRIAVCDSGSGIPPEILPHIFEPLFTTKQRGTGLGLAVVHQMITRNGGVISVDSTVGHGTRMEIVLPGTSAPVENTTPQPQPATAPLQRLLLVEDEPTVAAGLSALLSIEGIDVTVVDTGEAVPGAIEASSPEAVLLDLSLPDMDGAEVYDRIAARWPDLPVVFSTGNGDATRLARQLANPRVAFLRKPYDLETLLETLARVVLAESGQAESGQFPEASGQ